MLHNSFLYLSLSLFVEEKNEERNLNRHLFARSYHSIRDIDERIKRHRAETMSDDEEEGSTSDDSEFENEPKSGTDYVVQEAMREEKRKLKSKLRREKNKTVLPSGGEEEKGDDKRSLEEEHAENETIKSKRAIEDATRARKRARNGGEELE